MHRCFVFDDMNYMVSFSFAHLTCWKCFIVWVTTAYNTPRVIQLSPFALIREPKSIFMISVLSSCDLVSEMRGNTGNGGRKLRQVSVGTTNNVANVTIGVSFQAAYS